MNLKPSFIYNSILILFWGASMSVLEAAPKNATPSIQEKLAKLEANSGGRLGVSVLYTATNTRLEYRAEERFPMCSTFKSNLQRWDHRFIWMEA